MEEALAQAKRDSRPGAAKSLRAEQRGWIKGRDECGKAKDVRACAADAYRFRMAELMAGWMLGEYDTALEYWCEDDRANSFWAFFFPGDPVAVRIERGDSVRAGAMVEKGAGAQDGPPPGVYRLAGGVVLTIRGAEATLEWPPDGPVSCRWKQGAG